MDQRFAVVIERLHPAFERLLAMPPVRKGELPRQMPEKGVYLFSDGDRHLYVGRSNHLRKRYGQHSRTGSQHNQAVFAFKIARKITGNIDAVYNSGPSSRLGLSRDTAFGQAFADAKAQVRQMDYRFVEETDQTRQALLELYCAIALDCPFNDFNTH